MAAPVALVGTMGFLRRWTFDDAYVYFRTVDQIMAGNGPVWNAGQRVEAFASPLWLAVLAVGDLVSPVRLEYTAAAISLTATVLALVLAVATSVRLTRPEQEPGRELLMLPLGLAVFAALWPVWIWSTGGTEIGLALCWLGVCSLVLARWAERTGDVTGPSRAGLAVLGLGWTVGPTFALFSVAFVVLVIFGAPHPTRRRWSMAAWAVAIPVGYQVFRMGYYGMVLSTSSLVREGSTPRPAFGWDFLVDFLSPYVLAVPLVTIALVAYAPLVRRLVSSGSGRRAATTVTIVGSGLGHAALIVVVTGADGVHARLLLPAAFAVLVPVFVVPARRRYAEALVICGVWAVLCAWLIRPDGGAGARFDDAYPGRQLTYEDAGYAQRGRQAWISGPGFYVADLFGGDGDALGLDMADPGRIVVAVPGSDVLSYVLGPDIDVLDLTGTGDPPTAHQRLEFRLTPGAEKAVYGPWVVSQFAAAPAAVLPGDIPFERPFFGSTPPLTFLEQVAWAEATEECGRFERLRDASSRALTVDRFLANTWNAMSNTSVRFGTAPDRAFQDLRCGTGVPQLVEEFRQSVDVDGEFPVALDRGDVVLGGRCDVAFIGTGDPDESVRAIEGRERTATVELDPESAEPAFVAVFIIGPAAAGGTVVWVSTDGAGNAQVIQDVEWFPAVASPWNPITDGAPVEITIVPDLARQQWTTLVDGQVLAEVPMIREQRNSRDKDLAGATVDGDVAAVWPRTAAPGAAEPVIEHERYRLSGVCRAILAQHPSTASIGGGRVGRVTASIT